MSLSSQYSSLLTTPEKAVSIVKDGDWVDYGTNNSQPFLLDAALAKRAGELKDVKVRGNLLPGPIAVVEADPERLSFTYSTWHCGSYERRLCDSGRAFFSPMLFRDLSRYYRDFLTVDVAMISVSPPDDAGYCSLGGATGAVAPILRAAKKIILEINEAIPFVSGGDDTKIHFSRADAIVEAGYRELWSLPNASPTETDERIASFLLPYIHDGCTVQLGIGGIPNALGKKIASSGLRDLAMHTELCCDAYLDLFNAGVLTNSRKKVDPGLGVFGIAIGSRKLYDWIDGNPSLLARDLEYVNDVSVISSIDDMISINSCLRLDLYGQVSSESSGTRQISGTGGQLDFVTGASASKGGRSFLCLYSARADKNGTLHSSIVPRFTDGDIITTPRSQTEYVVTEQGIACLSGKTSWERAEALISIAHPAFRDELIAAAKEQRIWR